MQSAPTPGGCGCLLDSETPPAPSVIKSAAKEAIAAGDIDLLIGEELKITGAGDLFTVFGEPDIEISEDGGQLIVTVHGIDVYDPTTGEVVATTPARSRSG